MFVQFMGRANINGRCTVNDNEKCELPAVFMLQRPTVAVILP